MLALFLLRTGIDMIISAIGLATSPKVSVQICAGIISWLSASTIRPARGRTWRGRVAVASAAVIRGPLPGQSGGAGVIIQRRREAPSNQAAIRGRRARRLTQP